MAQLLLLMVGGAAAGVFGALLGLGGGVLIVPLLTLGFGLPLRESIGTSLVCVIVTSSSAASVYLRRNVANLRLGMTLELFTALGAMAGGLIAFALPDRVLAVMFAALLMFVAATMALGVRRAPEPQPEPEPEPQPEPELATAPGSDPSSDATRIPRDLYAASLSGPGYRVRNLGPGIVGSLLAGVVSALFGVGGGIVKVPVMNLVMAVPLRVATATSNLMIGVTASAGAVVYLYRGGIDPFVTAPAALGVFAGASLASRLADRIDVRLLRLLFVVMLLFTAVQMASAGLS
ncbi:MAG TPA: sulfite exporter TauE/SafE family protein [Candidatus Limnocylindrales bacterium]